MNTEVFSVVHRVLDRYGDVGFVAGGAARYVAMMGAAPEPGDIDVWFDNQANFEEAVTRASNDWWELVNDSPSARTYREPIHGLKVQFIKPTAEAEGAPNRRHGTPEEVIATFGFTCEQFALYKADANTLIQINGANAVEDTRAKKLRIVTIADPVYFMARILKYATKGFTCPPDVLEAALNAFAAADVETRNASLARMRARRPLNVVDGPEGYEGMINRPPTLRQRLRNDAVVMPEQPLAVEDINFR